MMSRRGTSLLIVVCTCFCRLLLFRASHDNGLHQLSNDPFPGTGKLHEGSLTAWTITNRQSDSTTKSAINRSPKLSEAEEGEKLRLLMPNMPIVYWQQNKKKADENNTSAPSFLTFTTSTSTTTTGKCWSRATAASTCTAPT